MNDNEELKKEEVSENVSVISENNDEKKVESTTVKKEEDPKLKKWLKNLSLGIAIFQIVSMILFVDIRLSNFFQLDPSESEAGLGYILKLTLIGPAFFVMLLLMGIVLLTCNIVEWIMAIRANSQLKENKKIGYPLLITGILFEVFYLIMIYETSTQIMNASNILLFGLWMIGMILNIALATKMKKYKATIQ